MSSTNHTTNYNLPQWVGSDKPAWLGDMNPAFTAIDTAIKANEVAAGTAGTDATTAKNNIGTMADLSTTEKGTLVGAVNEVNTKVGTAQNTADTAVANDAQTALALNNFMLKLNLTDFSNVSTIPHNGTLTGKFTLAQNNDGSIFKFYGQMELAGQGNISGWTGVAGLSGTYGIATGVYLGTAPTEAYVINTGGLVYQQNTSTYVVNQQNRCDIAVGTDGQIYLWALNWQPASINVNSGYAQEILLPACLYFNGSFGDTPTPNA